MKVEDFDIKVRGNRIAVTQLEEEMEGSLIVIPEMCKRNGMGEFELGTVLKTDKTKYCKPNDIIVFQMPQQVKASTTYRIKGVGLAGDRFGVLHEDDIIGILSAKRITLENFQIAGKWILCQMLCDSASYEGLALPDNYTPPIEDFRFKLLQKGVGCDQMEDVKLGTEVILERQRCNPIKLSGDEYCFIQQEYCYGVMLHDRITKLVPARLVGKEGDEGDGKMPFVDEGIIHKP